MWRIILSLSNSLRLATKRRNDSGTDRIQQSSSSRQTLTGGPHIRRFLAQPTRRSVLPFLGRSYRLVVSFAMVWW